MKDHQKISVTVITGFLGAGKTTFINFLLKKNPEMRFALVENEFGSVSVDSHLIKGLTASNLFELKQGCICCTIANEFELILQELSDRYSGIDQLLIETTGIADPVPVIRPFFRDENLKKRYHFNGTICLLDAINYGKQPGKDIALKQLAVADEVIVSKAEKYQVEKKLTLEKHLEEINPFSVIRYAEFGRVEDFELSRVVQKNNIYLEQIPSNLHSLIQTKTLKFTAPLNKEEFVRWFSYHLDIFKNNIYRVKGILCFENELYETILQGVGGDFELTEGDKLVSSVESTLVFTGNLERVELEYPQ